MDVGDDAAIITLLELLGRDEIIEEVPSDLARVGRRHEDLSQLLGNALSRLRLEVADAEAYRGNDAIARDSAVLRLFHQILYVRVCEDRRLPHSRYRVRTLIESDRPNEDLDRLLQDYRRSADSELFEPAGISVSAVPSNALRGVLTQTVEPWDKLNLDFSVARKDLAGKLYESYLASLPAAQAGNDGSPRLFPVAQGVDQRDKQATFYTPPALARLITARALTAWIRSHGKPTMADIRLVDPACGSGAFLTAAFEYLRDYFEHRYGRALRANERERLLVGSLFGADVDERALGLAQVQLLESAELRGRLPRLINNLLCGDSLPAPPGVRAVDGQVPWDAVVGRHGQFTTVVGNPPFGAQAKLASRLSIEHISALSKQYPEVKAFGQDYAYLFLALSLRLLVDGRGTAGLVMPRGLLGLGQGAASRHFLSDAGVAWIGDMRAARIFPAVAASVAGIVLDKAKPSTATVESISDSRINPRALLDDLVSGDSGRIAVNRVSRGKLKEFADDGWTPFRIRWKDELNRGIERRTEPLVHAGASVRVRTGVKTARVRDFVLGPTEYSTDARGALTLPSGRTLPSSVLPLFVYSSDIEPFTIRRVGRRVFLPYDAKGNMVNDPVVQAELADRGGLPANYQHGDLRTLRGPKLLIRAFGREPAAVPDADGELVPVMRGIHAVAFDGMDAELLAGLAALLNSAFYQWMLQGLGSPRADESIEITVADIEGLPVPGLDGGELKTLRTHANAAQVALGEANDVKRVHAVRKVRADLDGFVFDLLDASQHLRDVVMSELVRVA